jgi:hypothetical protein
MDSRKPVRRMGAASAFSILSEDIPEGHHYQGSGSVRASRATLGRLAVGPSPRGCYFTYISPEEAISPFPDNAISVLRVEQPSANYTR